MSESEFFLEPREEQPISAEEQTMRDIERVGISSSLRMLANLSELRKKGVEPSGEVLESLALLKHQIETYLGDLENKDV